MNRLAVWVAQTAMSVTVPRALAQATASPLTEIEDGAWLDPDIAAQPLVAMNVMLGLEGMGRRVLVQRARTASASNALSVHPVTARRMIPAFMTQMVLFRCRRSCGIERAVGHRLSARHGQPRGDQACG